MVWKTTLAIIVVLLIAAGGAAYWWFLQQAGENLVLPGTVEVQEVRLSSKIAGRVKPVRGFAVVVFALGLAMAGWSAFNVKPEAVRGGDVKNLAAMQEARVPSWFEFTNSFTGAIGILIGGRALGSKKRD